MSAARMHLNRAARRLAEHGTYLTTADDRHRDVECLAAEEAQNHAEWADGLTPSEYLLERVRRAQARKRGEAL